jgi:hypothetical protein
MLDGWEQLVCGACPRTAPARNKHTSLTRMHALSLRAVLSGVAIFFGVGYGLRVACLNAAAAINDALAARAALFAAK